MLTMLVTVAAFRFFFHSDVVETRAHYVIALFDTRYRHVFQ